VKLRRDFREWEGTITMTLNIVEEVVMRIEDSFKIRTKPISTKLLELLIRLIFLDCKDLFSDLQKENLSLFLMNSEFWKISNSKRTRNAYILLCIGKEDT